MEKRFIVAEKFESLQQAVQNSESQFEALPTTKSQAEREAIQMGWRVFRTEAVTKEQFESLQKKPTLRLV